MTSHVKLRKERVGVVDYDTQIKGKVKTSFTPTLLTLCSCEMEKKTNPFLNSSRTFIMSHSLMRVCLSSP